MIKMCCEYGNQFLAPDFILCVQVLYLHVCQRMRVLGARRGQKMAPDLLELELEVGVSLRESAKNRTQALYKGNDCL